MLGHLPVKSAPIIRGRKEDAYGDALQPRDDAIAAAKNEVQAAQDALNAECARIYAELAAKIPPLYGALNTAWANAEADGLPSGWYPRGSGDWGHLTDLVYDILPK